MKSLKLLFAAAAACVLSLGAFAEDDEGGDAALMNGGWTSKLYVNGTKITSKTCSPKGEGWIVKYDSKKALLTLNLSSAKAYTISGTMSGTSYDKKGNATSIKYGKILIGNNATVTLDNFTVLGVTGGPAVSIGEKKSVTFVLKGENTLKAESDSSGGKTLDILLPATSTLTIRGGDDDQLQGELFCYAEKWKQGGRLILEGGQVSFGATVLTELTVKGGSVDVQGSGVKADHFNLLGGTVVAKGDIEATNYEISGGELTLECDLRVRAGCELKVMGGIILSQGSISIDTDVIVNDKEVDCGRMIVSGGSIHVKGNLYGGLNDSRTYAQKSRLEVTGGRIEVGGYLGSRIDSRYDVVQDALTVFVSGGEIKVNDIDDDVSRLRSFEQRGGKCSFKHDLLVATGDFTIDDGTFWCDSITGTPVVRGGSCYWNDVETSLFPYSKTGCTRVTVDGLPANSRVSIGDLPFEYGKDNIVTSDGGWIHLWFPNRDDAYRFTVNGKIYEATAHGIDTTATLAGKAKYTVTYRTRFGQLFNGSERCWSDETYYEYEAGSEPEAVDADFLEMTCEGKRFVCWENLNENFEDVQPGEKLAPLTEDVVLLACWEEDKVAEDDGGFDVTFLYQKSQGSVYVQETKTVRQQIGEPFVFPTDYARRIGHQKSFVGWFTPGTRNRRQIIESTIADGSITKVIASYIDRTVRTTMAENDAFTKAILIKDAEGTITDLPLDRSSKESGETFYSSSAIKGTLWYRWTAPLTGRVTFALANHGTGADPFLACSFGPTVAAQILLPPIGQTVTFVCTAGTDYYVCVGSDGASSDIDLSWKAETVETANLTTWTMNRYSCAELGDLQVSVPALADLKKVTAENLPKGLKLVQDKAKTAWYIEGVPTTALDFENNFASVKFSFKAKGQADESHKLFLKVVSDSHIERTDTLGDECSMSATSLFGTAVDSSWKMSGLPTGVKYVTKDKTNPGFTGKFTKIGAFSVVGKASVKSGVPGLTTKFTENYAVEWLVEPSYGYTDQSDFTVYKGETMREKDITGTYDWAADKKCKASGLPSGMKFANGIFSGKVTAKTGYYAITVTSADKQAQVAYLARVADPSAPEIGAYFGAKKTKALKAIAGGDAETAKRGQYTFMLGATAGIPLTVTAGATVKATGLPAGLKVEQNKTTKQWAIAGAPTKTGSYLCVLTATLNGVSTTVTYFLDVVDNKFAGEYRGVIASVPGDGAATRMGTFLLNIAAGGATKVTVCEDGKSTLAYSAKSFGYSDSGDYAYLDFTLTPSAADKKLGYPARTGRVTVTIPNADAGDYRLVEGQVAYEVGTPSGEIEGWFVAANASCKNVRECRFFSCTDGDFDYPIATVQHEIKSSAQAVTADVGGKLYDGTAIKVAKLPLVRVAAQDETGTNPQACYALAPFLAKAKDGTVFVFHGFRNVTWDPQSFEGSVTFVDAAGEVRYVEEETADARSSSAVGFNDFFRSRYKTSTMFLDYGGDGFEMFTLDHSQGSDCLVLDADGETAAKIAAKEKIGLNGAFTYKFTSKDKVYTYQIDLVTAPETVYVGDTSYVIDSRRVVGTVIKTWKDGTATKTLYGIVDVLGLEAAE